MNEYHAAVQSFAHSSSPDGGHAEEDNGGDYSTRMEELFGGDEEQHAGESGDEDFVYDGMDADQVTGTNYRQHLRDVLGPDDTSDVFDEEEIKRTLLKGDPSQRFDASGVGVHSVSTTIIYHLVLIDCG